MDTWVIGEHARNQGVHVYGTQLLRHFRDLAPQYSVHFRPFVSRNIRPTNGDLMPASGFDPQVTRLLAHSRLWRYGGAWTTAALGQADVIFNPHCSTLYGSHPPTVTTIHDVIPTVFPWESRIARTLRFLLWSAVKTSRAIITVSEHSKADLLNVYGLPETRVHVVYNGCDHDAFNGEAPEPALLEATAKKLGIDRPYILNYGAVRPNKNLHRLVRAYHLLLRNNSNLAFDLVLAGAADSADPEINRAVHQDNGSRGRVIVTGALDQPDLVNLIKGASLAVFPSLYEGFCMPMIESMACGTPTIAARSSCLPEISGGVLRYFDPSSEEEMSACMEKALEDNDLRRALSEQGRIRARQFEWRRCAQQTLAILAQVAGQEMA